MLTKHWLEKVPCTIYRQETRLRTSYKFLCYGWFSVTFLVNSFKRFTTDYSLTVMFIILRPPFPDGKLIVFFYISTVFHMDLQELLPHFNCARFSKLQNRLFSHTSIVQLAVITIRLIFQLFIHLYTWRLFTGVWNANTSRWFMKLSEANYFV